MSRTLSELLNAVEPMFSIAVKQLEDASGNDSADVRLTSEIVGKVHMKTRELGLDPHDTTGKELYFALLGLVARHDAFLAKRIGGKNPEDTEEMLPLIKSTAEHLNVPRTAWVLKHSVAKRLLRATPPKRIMRQLGYRSIDSMLKRESIQELYAALRFAESPDWLNHFIGKYKSLSPSDFETRKIEFIQLEGKRWGGMTQDYVHKKCHNVTHLKELGVIVVLPMPVKQMRGVTLTVLPLLLHYINEIRLYSSFFKMQQVKAEFGTLLVNTLIADPGAHAIMAGQQLHWRVIHRYFGQSKKEYHPEIFEPHVQPEDLHWRKAEEILFRLEPALHFWHDMDYVAAMYRGKPVSFNLMDMAISYVNDLPYGHQVTHHFRESLWNEIFIRYLGKQTLENQILKQLDTEMIEPEIIAKHMRGKR